jgi:2'-5' RNA ligase
MKYAIVCLLKGKPKTYHKNLVKKLSTKFSIPSVSDLVEPHFTLKAIFETNKIKEVETLLKRFASKNKKSKVKLKGIGHFGNDVIFIKVILSKEAKTTYNKFVEELKSIDWMSWDVYEGKNRNFHVTLVESGMNKNFIDIWNYLKMFKPDFTTSLNAIAILTPYKGKWHKYKEFALKL